MILNFQKDDLQGIVVGVTWKSCYFPKNTIYEWVKFEGSWLNQTSEYKLEIEAI